MQQHPEIKVEVEEQLSGDIARALVDGVADIGVFAEGTPVDGLTVRPFQTDELVLIGATIMRWPSVAACSSPTAWHTPSWG